MFETGRKIASRAYDHDSAERGRSIPQAARAHPSKPVPLQTRRFSSSRSIAESSRPERGQVDDPKEDEWTAREAYDYALKRASGHAADEERVAIAIFYSMFPDAGNCYAAMDEDRKERMRWCARAAIAALTEKS